MTENKIIHEDIYSSSKFICYILKLFGLAPFGFDKKTRKIKMSLVNYVEFAVTCSFWIFLTYLQLENQQEYKFDTGVQSKLLDGLCQYQFLIQHFLATFTVVFTLLKRKNVENFLKFIFKFDQIVHRLDWKFKVVHSKYTFVGLVLVSFFVIITNKAIFIYILKIFGEHNAGIISLLKVFNICIVTEFNLILSMQFMFSTFCVYARLTSLTRNFRYIIIIPIVCNFDNNFIFRCNRLHLPIYEHDSILVRMQPIKDKYIIRNIAQLYDTLADAADEINSIFSKQVALHVDFHCEFSIVMSFHSS